MSAQLAVEQTPYHNAVTRSLYSPANATLLHAAAIALGIEERAVAGFKQWLEVGRVVRKGEHGTKIYMIVDKKEETTTGNDAKHRVCKMRTVFFQSQTIPLDGAPVEPETVEPVAVVAPLALVKPSTPKPSKGPSLRALAEGLQAKIDSAFSPSRLENTPKRRREAASARTEGYRLKRTQKALLALADLHDAGQVPEALQGVTTKAKAYELVGTVLQCGGGYYDAPYDTGEPKYTTPDAVALWELLDDNKAEREAEAMRRKMAEVRQSGIAGFFPTPPAVIDLMIERAEANATFWVNFLEPSAGDGAIASEILKRYPDAKLSLCEVNHTLCSILKAKGLAVEQADFLDAEPDTAYDCILMNPPFEGMADADHVRHAYGFLRPGGVLVAVMSPGPFFRSGAKAESFREWFAQHEGEVEDLPSGSFASSGTQVETKLVVIRC